jgi:ribonuclease E
VCSGCGRSSGDTARISTYGNRLLVLRLTLLRVPHHLGNSRAPRAVGAPQRPCGGTGGMPAARRPRSPVPQDHILAPDHRLGLPGWAGQVPAATPQGAGPAARVPRAPPCTSPAPAPAPPAGSRGPATPAPAQEAAAAWKPPAAEGSEAAQQRPEKRNEAGSRGAGLGSARAAASDARFGSARPGSGNLSPAPPPSPGHHGGNRRGTDALTSSAARAAPQAAVTAVYCPTLGPDAI